MLFQIRPQSEHWRHLAVEADRPWRVSPCSTQEMQARLGGGGRSGRRDHQRVVAAHHDVAIMDEVGVCDPGEAAHRLCVVDEQRFATRIGGGHDQRQILFDIEPMRSGRTACVVMEEQIMNRRRGQHQTDPGQLGRNPTVRSPHWGAFADHDRSLGTVERKLLGQRHPRPVSRRGAIGDHHRKGLAPRPSGAQALDRFGIARIAGQMEAAQALDRHDLAGEQPQQHICDRIARCHPHSRRLVEREAGTTLGAGVGLGMKAAVWRRVVFLLAGETLLEVRHAGGAAVVGQGPGQGVSAARTGCN